MLPTGLHRLVPRMASLVRKCVSLPHRNQIWQESCFSLPGYWLADRRSLQKEGGPGEGGEGEGGGGEGGVEGGWRLRGLVKGGGEEVERGSKGAWKQNERKEGQRKEAGEGGQC